MMSARRRNVYIIYYSTHGHIEKLAREVAKGVEKAGGDYNIIKWNNSIILFGVYLLNFFSSKSDCKVISSGRNSTRRGLEQNACTT